MLWPAAAAAGEDHPACLAWRLHATACMRVRSHGPPLSPPHPGVLGCVGTARAATRALEPVRDPGMSWSMGVKQLFFPSWLQGTWWVESTFKGASFPQGNRFIGRTTPGLQKGSIIAAMPDVGAGPLSFQLRFVRSGNKVVADRPFNYRQTVDAFLGYEAVQKVDYEPENNPTRAVSQSVNFTPRGSGVDVPIR